MATVELSAASRRVLWVGASIAALLLIISVVPWRRGSIYVGGADPVVVAKALVGVLSLGVALLVYAVAPIRGRVGIRSLILLAGIVAISTLGSVAADQASAAVVLSVRILLVSATVVVLAMAVPPRMLLVALIGAMGVVAVVAAVTGLAQGLDAGRLAGGIPEMAPNVLAGLAGPPAVALAVALANRGVRLLTTALLVVMLGIIVATGSRTSLIVVIVGIVLALLLARPLPTSTAIVTILGIPVAYVVLAFTDTASAVLTRGQSIEQLSTLSARTVAWDAVLSTPFDAVEKWVGVGLAAKTVAVQERWRDVQVLDSSWVSVIAQAGVIGTLLLIIWVVFSSLDSLRSPTYRALTFPLLAMILIRSFTENGLIESSATFVLFLAISVVIESGTRYPTPPRVRRDYALAEPLPALRSEARDRVSI